MDPGVLTVDLDSFLFVASQSVLLLMTVRSFISQGEFDVSVFFRKARRFIWYWALFILGNLS